MSVIKVVKEPCTVILSGPTGCGKTERILNLLQNEYKHHFDYIIILCPTLKWNNAYQKRPWIWKDDYIYLIDLKHCDLFDYIKYFGQKFESAATLFILDDIIADEKLDKRRNPLLDLAVSGRHQQHSLWFLTQSYTAIPKNLRRQKKQLFVWYPHEKSDLKNIDDETNILPHDKLNEIKDELQKSKYAYLYIRLEYPRSYIINE